MAKAAAVPAPANSGFIATPAFDLVFFILAPVLSLACAWLALGSEWPLRPASFAGGERTRFELFVAVWIYGHLAAVVFRSHLNAEIFRKHPLRFTLAPVLAYLAMAFSLPLLLVGALLASVWDAYHTAMQNFGLARIYDAKAGNPPAAGRTLDLWMAQTTYVGPLVFGLSFLPTIEGLAQFQAVGWQAPSQLLAWLAANQAALGRVVLGAGAAFVVYYGFASWRLAQSGHRVSWQKLALLASTASVTILAFGFLDGFRGYVITSLYHGFQYFGIVWWTERGHLAKQTRLGVRWVPLALLFAASITLAGLGYEAAIQHGTREVGAAIQRAAPHVASGPFWIFPIPFVISLMHFWWDGFVWSVQRKEV